MYFESRTKREKKKEKERKRKERKINGKESIKKILVISQGEKAGSKERERERYCYHEGRRKRRSFQCHRE